MLYFLLFNLVLSGSFIQKWYFPQGNYYGVGGRILVSDTDYDGHIEFIFTTYGGPHEIFFCELHLPDTFQLYSVPYLNSPLVWDVGDFDLDELYDLVIDASATESYPTMVISIAESPDSISYPTKEVWRDTIGPPLVVPISSYDIDRDGIPEIVKSRGRPYGNVVIYESTGDNQYGVVFADSIVPTPSSTHGFGDFDEDGNIEFVMGGMSAGFGAPYWVYESPTNNTYEKVNQGNVPTKNIKDCFAVDDADGDGKPEFVVKGFTVYGPPSHEIHTFIFEATGDNTYEIIKTFTKTYTGSNYYGGYSASGDVDGDGKPEIILEAATMLWAIKAVENDSFVYFASFTGYPTGSCVAIYDIDGNGLSEVIISGNNETRIFEYVLPGVEEASNSQFIISNYQLSVSPNPFRDKTDISVGATSRLRFADRSLLLQIYDVSGRLVKSVPLTTNHLSLGTDFKGGIYFLSIKDLKSGETFKRKLLKIE